MKLRINDSNGISENNETNGNSEISEISGINANNENNVSIWSLVVRVGPGCCILASQPQPLDDYLLLE